MKILVLGAGAVGGYFGGRLLEAGGDVTFLVRAKRARQLAEHGLVVKSPFGDIRRPVASVLQERLDRPYDLVLVTCKAYDLQAAIGAISPAMGEHSAVLPLLNGLAHMEALADAFGPDRVLGGMCQIAATLTPEGEIHHLNRLHLLVFGETTGKPSPRCRELASLAAKAAIESRLSDDIVQEMWEKFVMLCSLAAATCLFRASIGEIMETDEGEAIILELLDECAAVAGASGHPPREDVMAGTRGLLTERGSAFTASMLRDIERGGPTEADHIVGDMLRRARKLGIAAPILRVAFAHLQAYEVRRRAPSGGAGT